MDFQHGMTGSVHVASAAAILRALKECPEIGLVLLDADLKVTRSGVDRSRFHGFSARKGTPVQDLVPPEDAEEAVSLLRDVQETARPILAYNQRLRAAGELLVSLSVIPLGPPAAHSEGLLLVLRDITREAQAEEAVIAIGASLDVTTTAQRLADAVLALGVATMATINLDRVVWEGTEPPVRTRGGYGGLRRVAAARSDGREWPADFLKPGEDFPELPDQAAVRRLQRGEMQLLPDPAAITEAIDNDPDLVRRLLPAPDVHSMLQSPLFGRGGRVIGSVEAWRMPDSPPFRRSDMQVLRQLAARAGLNIDNARLYERERWANITLQRSMLPAPSARTPAAFAEGVYLPTSAGRTGAAGDWYDVIPLPSRRVALVVGDVVGHGLRATATMARLRTAVVTLAATELPPDELLTGLDDLVLRLIRGGEPAHEAARGSTCLVIIYDAVDGRCTVASAGHPPPVLVLPNGTAEYVDVDPGPPLGIGGLPFEVREREVPPGSVLALYTDGLVRSDRGDIEAGMDHLRGLLEEIRFDDLHGAASRVAGTLSGDPRPDDATLLLARVRTVARSHVVDWQVPDDPAAVADARALASGQLTTWSLSATAFLVELVVSELVTNAIRYSTGPSSLRLIHDGDTIICEVSDLSDSHPHLRRARRDDEGGRGLFLVAQVSERWGSRRNRYGKTIWAELRADALPEL